MAASVHSVHLGALLSVVSGLANAAPQAAALAVPTATTLADTWAHRYVVQSSSAADARQNVTSVGGGVSEELQIINGVSADLNPTQVTKLRALPNIRVSEDRQVGTRGSKSVVTAVPIAVPSTALALTDGTGVNAKTKDYVTNYPFLVNAELVRLRGITGKGVTIAVLDTGIWTGGADDFSPRILANVDFIAGGAKAATTDPYGHGTHVTSIAAGGAITIGATLDGDAGSGAWSTSLISSRTVSWILRSSFSPRPT